MEDRLLALLACPRCEGELYPVSPDAGGALRQGEPRAASREPGRRASAPTAGDSALDCARCAASYAAPGGVPALRLPGDVPTETVRAFYEAAPFPGYPSRDSLAWLRARAERSPFPGLLDAAIPADARIVEVGCGTGQMSLYLARGDRGVVGADLCRASLDLATAAASRFGTRGVLFVETDIHRAGLRPGAFDVVYSSGVLHHTRDPAAAFSRVARLARPGGFVVLGLYNAYARVPHRLRRALSRAVGKPLAILDPVLRDRRTEPARLEAWLRDQYGHPEEHRHTLGEVKQWLARNGIEYLRAYPDATLGAAPPAPDELFAPAADDWGLERLLSQLGWAFSLGREGGLFFVVGRRLPAAEQA